MIKIHLFIIVYQDIIRQKLEGGYQETVSLIYVAICEKYYYVDAKTLNVIRKLTEIYLTTGANNGYGISTNYDAYLSSTISFKRSNI